MPLTTSRFLLIAFLAVGSSGCVSTPTPARVPDPSTPREPERAPDPSTPVRPPLSFAFRDGIYAYDLEQLTTVTVGSEGASPVEDTLRTRAGLTYSISGAGGAPVISVSIDSLTIASVRDTTAPVRQLMTPVVVQLPVIPPPLVTANDSLALLSACDSMEEAARAIAGDLYIPIPVQVQEAQTWSDSTSVVLCRGAIPLTAVRVSRYRITSVRETRDSALATVARQTTLTVGGSGLQGTRRITVRGEGSSEATFTYDVRAGRLLESTGRSVLQLAFETIQQTEQVIQRSTSSTRLRSATPAGGE